VERVLSVIEIRALSQQMEQWGQSALFAPLVQSTSFKFLVNSDRALALHFKVLNSIPSTEKQILTKKICHLSILQIRMLKLCKIN
jgi:hypothetical protein